MSPAHRGFTLIELAVVIVLLAILAAVAVARFVDLSRTARVAAVNTLASAVLGAADSVHLACVARADCNAQTGNPSYGFNFDGQGAQMNYGWVDAGNGLHGGQIDDWVVYSGFTATLPNLSETRFTLDGAPDPTNCAVAYTDAYGRGPVLGYDIATFTAGC